MSRGVRLRAYAPGDLDAIVDFWVAAWNATGLPIDFEARRPWLVDRVAALSAEGANIIVACGEDGAPVGFLTLEPESGYLDQICVSPHRQRQGVARALLEEAKRRAPGRLELCVNVENPAARVLYEGAGFAVVGEEISEFSRRPTFLMVWTPSGDLR